jgi:2-(1,2-epoxy-1,2-dihydrophenyl)acetyl-CoA isomerase
MRGPADAGEDGELMSSTSAANATLVVEQVGRVGLVTLLRPAFTRSLRADLRQALEALAGDGAVGAVVIIGTGRVFVAGQDLEEHAAALARDPSTATSSLATEYGPVVELLASYPKPVVAAVNGVCAGGALGLALACDVRIAGASARFVPAFLDILLAPDCGVSALLGRTVGWGRARELLLTGRSLSADQAWAWGMVGSVVDDEGLRAAALSTADRLATAAPVVAATRMLLSAAEQESSLSAALRREGSVQAELARAPEHAAAVEDMRSRLRLRA